MCHHDHLSEEDLDCIHERFYYPTESWAELGEASQPIIVKLIEEIRLLRLVLTSYGQAHPTKFKRFET